MKLSALGAIVFLQALSGCSGSDAATPRDARGRVIESASGTAVLGLGDRTTYRPVQLAASGTLDGTITLQATGPDTVVATGKDATVCGDSAVVSETGASSARGNALVWIDGIEAGKSLPDLRRETVTMERCRFEPRVLAVVSGSTINVLSRDRVAHDARFYREGGGEPVAYVHTVDEGQVVPSEKIAATPGIVEVRCSRHPWARGYIAVFEHPYFAVTDANGAFRIDGIPAGTYVVKTWHEGMDKPAEQRVVIGAGGGGRLDVMLILTRN